MELTRDEEFFLFDRAVQLIIDSNVLMIGEAFEKLLKLIAYNHDLRTCVSDCYKTINYEKALAKYIVQKDGKFISVLPTTKKGIVGFVTKLILEYVDTTQSIERVLEQLYPDLNNKLAYEEYCKDTFTPYRLAMREVFLYHENVDQEESDDELPTSISTAAAEEVYSIARAMRSDLDGDNRLNQTLRSELCEILDSFCGVLENDNPKQLRSYWLAVKLSFGASKKSSTNIDKIEEILNRYSLI